jgi:hypothetical protein
MFDYHIWNGQNYPMGTELPHPTLFMIRGKNYIGDHFLKCFKSFVYGFLAVFPQALPLDFSCSLRFYYQLQGLTTSWTHFAGQLATALQGNLKIHAGQIERIDNRRKSVNGHRFPMPHLSRRGDKRVEMGHRPRKGRSPLISSHKDVHSARPSV